MDRPTFNQLLSRVDDETLQQIVGPPAVRLLNALNPDLATPSKLRRICLQLHSPQSLLTDAASRSLLLPLLRSHHALDLSQELGLSSEDPYRALETARIRQNSIRHRRLLAYFGVVPQDDPSFSRSESLADTPVHYGLFRHQRVAQREVADALQFPERRVLLHMPTGSGKTRTAMHIVTTELRRNEPSVVIWLAYSDELCEQAATEFEYAWSHLGDRNVDVYRYWGPDRYLMINDVKDGFMVAGLGKTYQRAKRDGEFLARLADRTALVIIDEAHQAIAETYRFLLDYLVDRNETTALVGLTATPGRSWNDLSMDEELSNFFRRKKVTLRVPGYDSPVDYLVDQEYLATPEFRPLRFHSSGSLDDAEIGSLASSLDIPESILHRLAEDEQRNLVIVNAVEDLIRRHKRILVFAATVDHAVLLAAVLQARGTDASAVTATTPRDERSRVIVRYKNNDQERRVLCNYGVLTAGLDVPRTSAAVIARPTKSLVLYSQMVGRATRGPRVGGNPKAEIVTVVDTSLRGFGDMAAAFSNWEDVWDE